MADTVTTNTIFGSASARTRKVIVHLTCISDGTGETNVVKVDRSTLLDENGNAPNKINIASMRWNTQGFTYIKLSWDHTADDTIAVLNWNGYENFESYGLLRDPNTSGDVVTGAIGDVLLSSVGAISGASYDITLECVLS